MLKDVLRQGFRSTADHQHCRAIGRPRNRDMNRDSVTYINESILHAFEDGPRRDIMHCPHDLDPDYDGSRIRPALHRDNDFAGTSTRNHTDSNNGSLPSSLIYRSLLVSRTKSPTAG